MFNYSSIKHLLNITISNSYAHYFFILFEYVCFIFPSVFQSTSKIHYYGYPISYYNSSTIHVNIIFPIKYFHESSSLTCQVTSFSLFIVILISYYIILILGLPDNKIAQIPFSILLNIMDLLLFRYLSSFLIDLFVWCFTDFYQYQHLGLNIASIVFLSLFVLFVFTSYSYVLNAAVLINISNPLLVNGNKKYPYDNLSSNYQIYLLFLKGLIAFEYNYLRTIENINLIIVSLNISIIFLSFILLFDFSIMKIYINFNCVFLYANFELNLLRNSLSIFNGFICLFTLLLYSNHSITHIILVSLLSLNATLFVLYFEYQALYRHFTQKQYITYELLLLLIIPDLKEKSLFDYRPIIHACFSKHLDRCKQTKCAFCLNDNLNISSYIDVFYKCLKKEEKQKSVSSFYEELAKLLYYKLKMKSVKLFRFYYNLKRKYEKKKSKANYHTLKIIVEDWLIKDNNDHCSSIQQMIQISKLEFNTQTLIHEMNDFFTEDAVMKTPETIIKLSNSIHALITEFELITVKHYKNEEFSNQLNESAKKTINGIMTYSTNIIRFIIQTLINQDIKGLTPIDIEHLDEFLYNHFTTDYMLICSIDLKSAFFKREVNIVKITGDLARKRHDKKLLSDFFPKEIKEEGIEQLNHQIYSSKNSEKDFLYPFQIKNVVSYIKFLFRLIQTIDTNNIILFGQYAKEKKKCILLDTQNLYDVKILSFCIDFLTLMQLRKKWIGYLKASKFQFTLQSIFKTVMYNEEKASYDCEFDYDYFINNSSELYQTLRASSLFQSNTKNEIHLTNSIDTLNQYSGNCIVLSLKRVTKYTNGCELYTSLLKTQCHSLILGKGGNGKGTTIDDTNANNTRFEATQLNFQENTFQSISIKKKKRKLSSIFIQGNQLTQFEMLDSELKVKIEKETKRLSLFSILMICFNLLLIIICFIFLATQVNKSNNLSILSELFFQFKSMRLCFTNFINTLGATSCYKLHPNDEGCVNTYSEYSQYFLLQNKLDPRLSLLRYTTEELRYKANYTQSVLNNIKQFLFSFHKTSSNSLLDDEMSYYEFDESDSKLTMVKKTIRFEEGLREYLNTMFILSEPNAHYEQEPLIFISYLNGEYNFDLLHSNQLSLIQKHLYKGLVNYMNFFYSFDNGEEHIMTDISKLGKENDKMNLVFMITLGCLNAFLGVFCIINIITAYHLFKILIINIINQLENRQFLKILTHKMKDLATLARLYAKNPNDLIKKILKNRNSPNEIEKISRNEVETITYSPNSVSFGNQFYIGLLGNTIIILISLFGIFFFVIIVFNTIITDSFAQLFRLFNYTSLYYNFENSIYSNIAFTGLIHFCNITNDDFAGLIGRTNPPAGILNDLIQVTLAEVQSLAVYSTLKSKTYPLPKDSFNYSCDEIFYGFEDTFIKRVSDETGMDYRIISQTSCDVFDSLILDHFFFLQSDMVDRTHKLANTISGRTYDDLIEFNGNYDLYELFTLSIFIFRPLSFYYREIVLLPTISNSFKNYVNLIAIYLVVNIILQILLFVIVKWVIINRLDRIRDNLYLVNHCVS